MSPGELKEKGGTLVAGAVVGVLGTLLLLAGLVEAGDAHFVTRKEYDATLMGIRADLSYLRAQADVRAGKVAPGAP